MQAERQSQRPGQPRPFGLLRNAASALSASRLVARTTTSSSRIGQLRHPSALRAATRSTWGPIRGSKTQLVPVSAVLVIRPSSLGDISLRARDRFRHPSTSARARHRLGRGARIRSAPRDVPRHPQRGPALAPALGAKHRSRAQRGVRSATSGASSGRSGYATVLDLQEQAKGAVIARAARGRRHGFDRASVREPLATLGHDVSPSRGAHAPFLVDRRRARSPARHLATRSTLRHAGTIVPPPTAPGSCLSGRSPCCCTRPAGRKRSGPKRIGASLALISRVPVSRRCSLGQPRRGGAKPTLGGGIDDAIVPPWLSLPEAATLLAHAEIVVGVDTGFTHLAGALGTSTVGSSSPPTRSCMASLQPARMRGPRWRAWDSRRR